MECFAKIVNYQNPLPIIAKRSILDVWQGFEYTYVFAIDALVIVRLRRPVPKKWNNFLPKNNEYKWFSS